MFEIFLGKLQTTAQTIENPRSKTKQNKRIPLEQPKKDTSSKVWYYCYKCGANSEFSRKSKARSSNQHDMSTWKSEHCLDNNCEHRSSCLCTNLIDCLNCSDIFESLRGRRDMSYFQLTFCPSIVIDGVSQFFLLSLPSAISKRYSFARPPPK